jgi:hypothetical protein
MHATDVVGYAYEADVHCVECSEKRFACEADSEPSDYEDNDGNPVHPIFAGGEDAYDEDGSVLRCGDCGEFLSE